MKLDSDSLLNSSSLLLYAVTDRSWLGEETLYSQVEKALKGGATMIQLREKDLSEEAFLDEARSIKELCGRYGVPFLINDSVEIAAAVDACRRRPWNRRFWRRSTEPITWE